MLHRTLYPFLFALYPVLALYAFNIGQTAFADTFRPALLSLAAAGALFILLRGLVKNGQRAGLAVTVLLLLFFSYGHVYNALSGAAEGSIIARADVLAALWAVALIVLPWLCLRVLPAGAARGLTPVLNITGAAALLLASLNIGAYHLRNGFAPDGRAGLRGTEQAAIIPAPDNAPDIYYLVVDSYGRQDVLLDQFGADQRVFFDYLKARGFVIAENSTTNYPHTLLSLSSSLNMNYVDQLVTLRPESSDTQPLLERIRGSEVVRFAKQHGYQTIFIASNYLEAEGMQADVFLSPTPIGKNLFEATLLRGSMLVMYYNQVLIPMLRDTQMQSLELLREQAAAPGPKLVIFYTTLLHSPFTFAADGSAAEPQGTLSNATPEGYLRGFPGQLGYTNRVMQQVVETILQSAGQPPVIVIQGDHGPAMHYDYDTLAANTCLRERFAIMNAYYLPGAADQVYDSFSAVNTFRVIFNAYFDQHYDLLPDRSYHAAWNRPYDLTEVTGRTAECSLPEAQSAAP